MEITSRRHENLSQEAQDLLAVFFEINPWVNAIEVPVHDSVERIIQGGDGFATHEGLRSERYFSRRNDPSVAVVLREDCTGNAEDGRALIARIEKEIEGK